MNLQPIRERLAAQVSDFRRVKGAAQFAAVAQRSQFADQAFVIPLQTVAGKNMLINALEQRVNVRFAVLYWVRDVSDADGEGASDAAEVLGDKVVNAIVAWTPPGALDQITYLGSRLLRQDNGAVLWADEFETSELLRKIP